ncbi:unnamed protein product, partial [Vitis vinifera]
MSLSFLINGVDWTTKIGAWRNKLFLTDSYHTGPFVILLASALTIL